MSRCYREKYGIDRRLKWDDLPTIPPLSPRRTGGGEFHAEYT